jgi:hypothetical protein
MDLPPTSHPWGNGKSLILPRLVPLHEMRKLRPGANKTHRPGEDIEKLRKFVQAKAAKEASHAGHAWVVPGLMNEMPISIPLFYIAL